jgi:membrane-associated phospholipid phosphatase
MDITPRRRRILTYILITIVIGFILLTVVVSLFPPSVIDLEFSEEIQEHQFPLLDFVMKVVSYPGYMPYAAIMVAVTALVFYATKHKKEALFVVLTTGAVLVSTMAKALVDRPRPAKELVRIILATQQQSFPSGHVMFYVVFFGFLTLLMYMLKHISKPVRLIVSVFNMTLIFIIPISRIYLGAHWFTDVLGGFLLGILYLYGLSYFYLKQR